MMNMKFIAEQFVPNVFTHKFYSESQIIYKRGTA